MAEKKHRAAVFRLQKMYEQTKDSSANAESAFRQ